MPIEHTPAPIPATATESEAERIKRLENVKVEEGAARAKKAFEEGAQPADMGRADDGKPSADDNARANDKTREAIAAGDFETPALVRSRDEAHKRADLVVKADTNARLGFDPKSSAVKRPGDPGVTVHVAPSAPPPAAAQARSTEAGQAGKAGSAKAVGTVIKK